MPAGCTSRHRRISKNIRSSPGKRRCCVTWTLISGRKSTPVPNEVPMKIAASRVPGVKIYGPDAPEFDPALFGILGRAPKELLAAALPFSVIVENASTQAISLLGVRFDMTGPKAKQYSVLHYADTLRNPEKAEPRPGA